MCFRAAGWEEGLALNAHRSHKVYWPGLSRVHGVLLQHVLLAQQCLKVSPAPLFVLTTGCHGLDLLHVVQLVLLPQLRAPGEKGARGMHYAMRTA